MVTGAEGHLGTETDIVSGTWRIIVISLTDSHFPVHDYRLELAFPLGIPVHIRNRQGRKRSLERKSGKDRFQGLPVEKRFLDITIHTTVTDFKRIVREI